MPRGPVIGTMFTRPRRRYKKVTAESNTSTTEAPCYALLRF